ncbi:hypothetical protein [Streptodolium elevatio]
MVFEFAILPAYRRLGLGGEMHAALVGPWTGERTTVTARPEAQGAIAFWRAEGYEPLGHTRPWDTAPVHLMMVRNQPKQA